MGTVKTHVNSLTRNPSLAPDTKLFVLAPVLKHVPWSVPGIASDIKKPGSLAERVQRHESLMNGILPDNE